MKLKHRHSHLLPTLFALALFLLAISAPGRADDKKKPQSAPKAQSKPAQTSHSSGANTSHGGNTGKPSGNSTNGRPSGGNNGRPGTSGGSNTSHGGNTGRPGSANGSTGNNRGNTGNTGGRTGPGNNTNNGRANNTNNAHGNNTNNNRGGNNANNNRGNSGNNAHGGNAGRGGAGRAPVRHEAQVGNHRVATDGRGRVREISGRDSRGRDLAVHRDLRGGSRFETRGAGGRRIVGYGHGRGFTERRFVNRGGHVYVQRTYVYGGRSYAYAYRSYYWHGNPYYGYAPAFYFHPGFYGWAYNPWAAPVYYNWGWGGNPWFVGYGYYFNPYPVYPSASLWLTDYLLAESLKAAYESRADANANAMQQDANDSNNNGGGGGNNAQVALSPEVKQMIADEVKRQLDAERSAAAQPAPANQSQAPSQSANNQPEETPAALDPSQRVFVVAGNVDMAADSGECAVTAGDVLVRSGEPNGSKIAVSVVSSKKGDCSVGTNADVEVSDLQEMHNQFREKLDTGLKTLADNSGKNGLPKAPDTGTTGGEVPAPQPDADADGELQNQQKDAESAEQDVQKGSPGGK
jgi:hypothetical protein